jgi:hypothetical protein
MVSFDYQPSTAASLPAGTAGAKPSVSIVSPADGATVNKTFDLKVAVQEFKLSCDAEGKPDAPGVGHLHVFVKQAGVTDKTPPEHGASMGGNSMSSGEMSMVGMIGMPCTQTVPVNLSSWNSGKAKVIVLLASNDHMPAMGTQAAAITVNLK